ncbi:PIN-like domain-containing protein [Microbispora rosea]|uniref:PIN-like domain-containing protein n=1 Tax=Microbispora rosea TaxID=58117 RepID=UPI00379551EF
MDSLTSRFGAYYPPSNELLQRIFKEGLIVLDANVLLNLYRYLPSARDELFNVLERLATSLWVPDQVGFEFSRRRLAAIRDHRSAFDSITSVLTKSLGSSISGIAEFANRISLDPEIKTGMISKLEEVYGVVRSEIAKIGPDSQISGSIDAGVDPITVRLEQLLAGKIGPALPAHEKEKVRAEAARRADLGIPPGYKDKAKGDSSGDYLIWYQMILEAGLRKVPVMLVTDDVKEDWWLREHGQTLGPRPELYEEMLEKAGVSFVITTTGGLLKRANTFLGAEVSAATIEAAQEVLSTDPDRGHSLNSEAVEVLLAMADRDEYPAAFRGTIQYLAYSEKVYAFLSELPGMKVRRRSDGSGFILGSKDGSAILVLVKYFSATSTRTLSSRLREFEQRKAPLIDVAADSVGILMITNVELPDYLLERHAHENPEGYRREVVTWNGQPQETRSLIEAISRLMHKD